MTRQDQSTYELLETCSGSSFRELYEIYSEAIPLRERKDQAKVAAMLARDDYKILVAKRGGSVIGFSILFSPPGEQFCLMEYLAVQAVFRGEGVGAELFHRCLTADACGRGEIPLLLEVESAGESSVEQVASAEKTDRERRQQFYRRMGCLRVESLVYQLPLHGVGRPAPMDMLIHCPETLLPIGKERLKHWLSVIYQVVYQCSPDDPRITEMLEKVADPVRLA